MKTNKYADLINFGLSQKTLLGLNESEINTLHKNLIEGKKKETKEQTTPQVVSKTVKQVVLPPNTETTVGSMSISNKGGKTTVTPTTEGEMSEEKDKQSKQTKNPWAICHAQLGPKKTPKFERCVKEVKKQISEGKDPFAILLENKIVALLEKHIQPKMKKKELLDLINNKKMKKPIGKIGSLGMMENDTETAPAKPVTKPDTKPSTKPKPFNPYDPKPSVKPAPKAKDSKTKKAVDKKHKPTSENKVETFEANEPAVVPTKPGTKTPPKPKPFNPYDPKPSVKPAPKAKNKMPDWLKFNNLGLNLK